MKKLLDELKACSEASEWVGDKCSADAWAQCERADWMLWLLSRMAEKPGWPDWKTVRLLVCDCAETSLKYATQGDDRPKQAIDTARKWLNGEATEQERSAAASAAWAAARAAEAAWAAEAAAWAARAAARAAAEAAAEAARAAAWSAAWSAAHKTMADMIRAKVPEIPEVE